MAETLGQIDGDEDVNDEQSEVTEKGNDDEKDQRRPPCRSTNDFQHDVKVVDGNETGPERLSGLLKHAPDRNRHDHVEDQLHH
jgi:hypothetical protein